MVELALQGVRDRDTGTTADEYLPDHGFELLDRLAQAGVVAGHVTPAEQHLALVLDGALDLVFAGEARRRVAGQKHHADAVLPGRWQIDAVPRQLLAEKPVRDLDQATRAVAQLRVPAHRATVREVSQHRETLLDDRVRLPALDVRDKADATGVMLMGRVIQALRCRHLERIHV